MKLLILMCLMVSTQLFSQVKNIQIKELVNGRILVESDRGLKNVSKLPFVWYELVLKHSKYKSYDVVVIPAKLNSDGNLWDNDTNLSADNNFKLKYTLSDEHSELFKLNSYSLQIALYSSNKTYNTGDIRSYTNYKAYQDLGSTDPVPAPPTPPTPPRPTPTPPRPTPPRPTPPSPPTPPTPTPINRTEISNRAKSAARDYISERWAKYSEIETIRRSYFEGFKSEMNTQPSRSSVSNITNKARTAGTQRAKSNLNSINFKNEVSSAAYNYVKSKFLKATNSGAGIPSISTTISKVSVPSKYNSANYAPLKNKYSVNESIYSDSEFNKFFDASAISVNELKKTYTNNLERFSGDLALRRYLSTSRSYYSSLGSEGKEVFKTAFTTQARRDLDNRKRKYYYWVDRRSRDKGKNIAIDYYQVAKLNTIAAAEFNASLRANFNNQFVQKYKAAYSTSTSNYFYNFKNNPVIILDSSKVSIQGTPAPGASLNLSFSNGFIKNIGGVALVGSTTNFRTSSNDLRTQVSSDQNDPIDSLSVSGATNLPGFLTISESINIDNAQNFTLEISLKGTSRAGKTISEKITKEIAVSFNNILASLLDGSVAGGEEKLASVLIKEFQQAIDAKQGIYVKDYKVQKSDGRTEAKSKLGRLYIYFRDNADSVQKEAIKRVISEFRNSAEFSKTRYWVKGPTNYYSKKYIKKYFDLMNI